MDLRSLPALGLAVLGLGGSASTGFAQEKVQPLRAIQDGLAWLARHQNPDGSWSVAALKDRCPAGSGCCDAKTIQESGDHFDEGVTGLALLCFLRAGFGDESRKEILDGAFHKRFKAGEVVRKGLTWLQSRQMPDGRFKPERAFMYNEACATMAMAESCRLSRNEIFRASAQRAVDFLQGAQRPNPSGEGLWGWRYASRQEIEGLRPKGGSTEQFGKELHDSDISATGWAVAALVSARGAGLEVRKEAFDGAIAFCNFVTIANGEVGYLHPDGAGAKVTGPGDHFTYHTATMSALGMCIRLEAERDRTLPFFELAAQRILRDLPVISGDRLSVDYYYWYEGSMALNLYDGEGSQAKTKKKSSGPWNKATIDALLELQPRTRGVCSFGGWTVPDRWSYTGGPIYSTAIAVLTLQLCTRK